MINEWLLNMNYDKIVGCVTLDFKKAFDVLSHDILIKKLELYGCDRLSLHWFNSYLKDRSQHVFIGNSLSEVGYIKHGVPQGSILGPLFFIIFINDLSLHVTHSNFYKYADDSTMCVYDTTVNNLEQKLARDLKSVENGCIENRIVINTSKSKCMIICSHQKRVYLPCDHLNIAVDGISLENVDHQKVLGLFIDKNMSWNIHIDNLCRELSKLIGLLWRNRHLLPYHCRLLFYNSFILPRIDYCLPIWGNSSIQGMNKIWRLQKKAVRLICNVPFDAPTADLFKNLRFMNIFERHLYQLCISVFKILSSHNSPMSNLISLQNYSHSYNLRSNTDFVSLEVPFPHKESFKKSFYYSAPFIWNRLPGNARSAPSLAIFKKLCKSYILSMNVCNNVF